MSKFIFDHVDNLEYHTDSQKDMIFNPTRKFTFDDGCIKSLRQNHRVEIPEIIQNRENLENL